MKKDIETFQVQKNVENASDITFELLAQMKRIPCGKRVFEAFFFEKPEQNVKMHFIIPTNIQML